MYTAEFAAIGLLGAYQGWNILGPDGEYICFIGARFCTQDDVNDLLSHLNRG